jgi:ferric-dicitrate binding protein FerR (iron transport regulator)
MRRLALAALVALLPVAALAAIMTQGGRRVVLLGGKPFVPVSSGFITQVDGVSQMTLVDGTTVMLRTN